MTTKEFWLLDLDRTLLDLDVLVQLLYEVLDESGVMPSHELHRKQTEIEESGGSFSPVAAIIEYGGEALWQAVQLQLIERADKDLLRLSGATQLLHALDAHRRDYAIMTYGVPAWQTLKLQLAGFDTIPYIIIDTPQKGQLIDSWRDDNDCFVLPKALGSASKVVCVETLALVDDKQLAFNGLPTQVRGYWVQTGREAALDTVPTDVTACATLHDLIKHVI